MGAGNESFADADIRYSAPMMSVSVTDSEQGKVISVSPENVDSGVVLMAMYGDGALISCDYKTYAGEAIEFELGANADYGLIKLFYT